MPTSQKFRDAKRIMGLDQFGYPANAIANRILVNMDDFGVNTKDLITTWYTWLHYNPFDIQVSEKLTELLTREIQTLDPGKDAGRIRQLQKKQAITRNRAIRYRKLTGESDAI